MKNYFLFFLGMCILSCSDDQSFSEPTASTSEIFKVDPVLSFDDWDSFYKIYNEISTLNEEELILWASEQPHSALILSLNKNEELKLILQEDIDILTNGLLGILNDKMEFQVGKNIIHFEKGNFLSIPLKEYTNADIWNNDVLNDFSIVGNAQKSVLTSENMKTKDESRTELGLNDIKGSYQREFFRKTYRKCSGGTIETGSKFKFKYVHELVSKSFSVGYPVVVIELYVDVKLEYRSSKWRAAGEDRHITISLSGTAEEPKTLSTPVYFNINRTLNCVNSNQRILIAQSQYATNIGLPPRNWIVNAQGVISQEINYDASSNKWVNYISW